jgi:hypothetical protein
VWWVRELIEFIDWRSLLSADCLSFIDSELYMLMFGYSLCKIGMGFLSMSSCRFSRRDNWPSSFDFGGLTVAVASFTRLALLILKAFSNFGLAASAFSSLIEFALDITEGRL